VECPPNTELEGTECVVKECEERFVFGIFLFFNCVYYPGTNLLFEKLSF
jgi:hypothetical protein